MMRLANQWALGRIDEASNFVWSERFRSTYGSFVKKYPPGSEEFRKVVSVCAWFETVGTLYKHGLLNRELLFDWLAITPIWDRVKGVAVGMRKDRKIPALWENFELMAKAQAK